jgi:hypothetical protein
VDPKAAAAEYAEYAVYAEELRRRGWSQPAAGLGQQKGAADEPIGSPRS